VKCDDVCSTSSGSRYWFQLVTNASSPTVINAGFASGSRICAKYRNRLAPSTSAASRSSPGMARRKGRRMSMVTGSAKAPSGIATPNWLSSRPRGCDVATDDTSAFAEAVTTGRSAELIVAVVGDEAGLFGHGTSGEGCDATDLNLPGVQRELLDALAGTGTPVVAVLITGRPYALGDLAGRLAAAVQAFFPGEEGGRAIAGVLTGPRSCSCT
jgi:hypothetical protein